VVTLVAAIEGEVAVDMAVDTVVEVEIEVAIEGNVLVYFHQE
jgi:hypothetical protein